MEDQQREMREIAIKLFKEGSVDMLIGYEAGSLPLRASPCVIEDAESAEKLVWNANGASNLANYLRPLAKANPEKKIGIMARGCESRTIVGLIKERQIQREQIFVIGLPCTGVVDRRKISDDLDGMEILEAHFDGDVLNLKYRNDSGSLQSRTYENVDFIHNSCSNCQHRVPVLYDILIGEENVQVDVNPYERVDAIESQSIEERWEYFASEMSKCIRCYACRGACPFCYCDQCFIDQNQPQWFGKTTELSDTMIFHLVRAFHVAGRCVNCGACARACPMGVDLMSLTKKIEKDMSQLYGYMAGMEVEELAPFATFKEDDPQEFITEPE